MMFHWKRIKFTSDLGEESHSSLTLFWKTFQWVSIQAKDLESLEKLIAEYVKLITSKISKHKTA